MKLSEKTERIIEVEFDESEMQILHRIEDTFNLTPRAVVAAALEECIRTADAKIARFQDDVGMSSGDGG